MGTGKEKEKEAEKRNPVEAASPEQSRPSQRLKKKKKGHVCQYAGKRKHGFSAPRDMAMHMNTPCLKIGSFSALEATGG